MGSHEILQKMDTMVTEAEQVDLYYLNNLYDRLLEHRYRYYVLNDPVLADWEYDWMEKYYNGLAEIHGGRIMKMVDFDPNDPLAIAAGERVKSGTDGYSTWEKSMKEVWDRLGKSRKQLKEEQEK